MNFFEELGIRNNESEKGYEYPKSFFGREIREGEVSELFEKLLDDCANLRELKKSEELNALVAELYERYFSVSPGAFDYLPLERSFDFLIQINKNEELRGPIGQAGVGSIVYRLAGFQYTSEDEGEKDIHNFIENALNGKSASQQIESLIQLQTIAASALANGEWAKPVYNAILSFLKRRDVEDIYIVWTLKKRIHEKLIEELGDPTMSVITTLNNRHQALMFEDLITEEEKISSDAIINSVNFTGDVKISSIIPISSDQYGLYDSQSILIGILPKKIADVALKDTANAVSQFPDWNTYKQLTRYFQPHVATGYKILALIRNEIVLTEDEEVLDTISTHLNADKDWFYQALKAFKKFSYVGDEGLSEEDRKLIYGLEDCLNQKLDLPTNEKLDAYLTETFRAAYHRKQASLIQVPLQTLDSNETKSYLSYLGLAEKDQTGLSIFEDPFFRRTVERLFGINLNTLDFRIQISVLKFISTKSLEYVEDVAAVIQKLEDEKDRRNAFVTLVANEQFQDVHSILELLSRDHNLAHIVYQKFAETVASLDDVVMFLEEHFKKPLETRTITRIRESLIQKATQNLLENKEAVRALAETSGDEKARERYLYDREVIIAEIQRVSQEILFLLATFKTYIKENPDVELESIENITPSTYSSRELLEEKNADLLEKMREMYRRNVPNEERRKELLSKFDSRLAAQGAGTTIDVLFYKDELLAFVVFSKNENGSLFASGLNVSPEMRGSGIGETMLRETILAKMQTADIYGNVLVAKNISRKYLRDGAIMFNPRLVHEELGMDVVFSIKNKNLKSKHMPERDDDALTYLIQNYSDDPSIHIVETVADESIPLEQIPTGFALTQILKPTKDKTVYVFEESIT